MIHPWAWVGWVGASLVALSKTRNPLHLVLMLLSIAIVNALVGFRSELSLTPVSPLRFALIVIPLSAAFNALTVHFGDTVLLRLPDWLPLLGGPVTLEALVYGALNGLVLAGILAAFTTLNQALPVRALVRLIPRAFYPVAVVTSIAVTFVPTTMRQFEQIREAQAVRGHRMRGLRDWLPLFMPLLVGGLERALGLAEAMTARGFASADDPEQDVRTRAAVVVGLVALLGGWLLRLAWGYEALGLALMVAGSGVILVTLWAVGRRVQHTTYRHEPWTGVDWGVALSAAAVLVLFLLPGLNRVALVYYPYPSLSWPSFDPVIGLISLGLLGPALALVRR